MLVSPRQCCHPSLQLLCGENGATLCDVASAESSRGGCKGRAMNIYAVALQLIKALALHDSPAKIPLVDVGRRWR